MKFSDTDRLRIALIRQSDNRLMSFSKHKEPWHEICDSVRFSALYEPDEVVEQMRNVFFPNGLKLNSNYLKR